MKRSNPDNILEARGLSKTFGNFTALDSIDFCVSPGEVLAIVGESGSGKTTAAKIATALLQPDSGGVYFKGKKISDIKGAELASFRRKVQIIFQDPVASLNPRMTVGQALAEPLLIHKICGKKDIPGKVTNLLADVGLSADHVSRYPHEISGGECQRVCIGRVMSLMPEVVILDEPVSSLDFSLQEKITNLLMSLKEKYALTYVFITHDLDLAAQVSENVCVMKNGKIVEAGKTEAVFRNPSNDYTKELLASRI